MISFVFAKQASQQLPYIAIKTDLETFTDFGILANMSTV